MYISFVAIFLMFVCNFLLIFARKKAGTFISVLIKIFSFLLLLLTFGMIIIVMFV
ncbi:DUF2768 family protein [Brevibacillus daliensis]|uniref:DUF2768 family protein n=1 Tax=Brevibacillus daliensis TaxID=2892995 RepID=UPI0021046CE0|nr:DUF2768 family protein [Brevibacillus daliensis]